MADWAAPQERDVIDDGLVLWVIRAIEPQPIEGYFRLTVEKPGTAP